MKVIQVDNYNRETVAEKLIMCGLDQSQSAELAALLNKWFGGEHSQNFYREVPEDHKLWRGMADLVGDPPIFDVDAVIAEVRTLPQYDHDNWEDETAKREDPTDEGIHGAIRINALRKILDKYANPS